VAIENQVKKYMDPSRMISEAAPGPGTPERLSDDQLEERRREGVMGDKKCYRLSFTAASIILLTHG
jgi:hypothetical protein